MSRIDWRRTARGWCTTRCAGCNRGPARSTTLGAHRLIVGQTRLDDPPTVAGGAPGEVVAVARDRVWVATAQGLVALTNSQLEGRKRFGAREFLAGHPLRTGAVLGQEIVA